MATLLTWVAATNSAWRGFSYLFVFSLGMCSLLVVVGLTAGKLSRLPRAGAWMIRIKQFFGTSENAVKTQIWTAVSTYVLVAIVRKRLKIQASLYEMLQILSLTMFEKIPTS